MTEKRKTLSDLLEINEVVPVTLKFLDDEYEVDFQLLSHHEWMELELSKPVIKAPHRPTPGGRRGETFEDRQDPEYREKVQRRQFRINMERLVACIGDQIPKEGVDAKIDWLERERPPGVVSGLVQAMYRLHNEGWAEEDADARASSFLGW